MYIQDVFTEEEYKKIVEDISQRKVFETKYFNFNKARFTIGMIPTSYLDLWPEGLMVSIGADKPTSGHGVGETPKRMLEIFESYQSACEYVDRSLKAYVDEKYQGIKVETQISIFDFME